ncbi:MAG: peptidase [Alkaliphilus sp.]|nr:MAG: peptidase [Alkaliphilus sp.]
MTKNKVVNKMMKLLAKENLEKYQIIINNSKKTEMVVERGEISLLRTTSDTNLRITAINENKKASVNINKVDDSSLEEATKNVLELLETSEVDDAYDISPFQEARQFESGSKEPNKEDMYKLITRFIGAVKLEYPKLNISESALTFNYTEVNLVNSNGVDYLQTKGIYSFYVVFTAKDGDNISSMNFVAFSMNDLEKDLLDTATLRRLIKENIEQLETKPITEKFAGDVLITPDYLAELIATFAGIGLSDGALIAGTSVLKDSIGKEIASPKLTIRSNPRSKHICDGYSITSDGFEAKNLTIVENGVLKNHLLGLYGAKKTAKKRAENSGDAYVVDPGGVSYKDMVKKVKKGILLSRFSGGNPSPNGDFSGIAKNSYYIEDGKVQYPISETMIAGNIYDMLKNIKEISKEQVNFGNALMPWLLTTGVTISGK